MIDWFKGSVPLSWSTPICGGHVVQISPAGEIERATVRAAHARGSFDEHLTLRTVEAGRCEFDGNPSKFLQGHNIAGSADLGALVEASMLKALALLDCSDNVAERDRQRWLAGDFSISRIDVTEMYALDNAADVRAWLRAAGELARVRWRGRGVFEGTTLYFGKVARGKRAANWALKCYAKGDEIAARAKGHGLPENLPLREELIQWADNKLRVEVTLRSGELKRFAGGKYETGQHWNDDTAAAIFGQYFAKMEIGNNVMLPVELEESLKPALRIAYNSWKSGQDLRGILSRATFFRYKAMLLKASDGLIDIAVPQAATNVVPLRRVLTLAPAQLPHWLLDRPDLLFRRAA